MKMKEWIKAHTSGIIIFLVLLLGGYYMYLTHVSTIFHIKETYYISNDDCHIILDFKETELSLYVVDFRSDMIASRTDYDIGYRTYTKDFLGNFWSDDGLESFSLRGSDTAGRMYAECVGSAIWDSEESMKYIDRNEIEELEKTKNTDYSILSDFSINGDGLMISAYGPYEFQPATDIPEVVAELTRLLDSLCPREK